MKIVFATHNNNKLKEVSAMLPNCEIVSLTDIGCNEDIPETATTLEGNAKIKANYVTTKYGLPCFADDTGLLVDALNGEPGVYSARYAGEHGNAEKNMALLLEKLEGNTNRKAHFKTAVCLNLNGEQHLFEGICNGEILTKKQGNEGFGYDPIFRPDGFEQSFAEMNMEEKGKISHRGLAVQKLITFLQNI
ncbi:non-canonical purine NTP diphosphatase [Wenyingzhuangia sp. IMCC45574]